MSYVATYIQDAIKILEGIDHGQIDKMVDILVDVREKGGRLFFLGVGGSAANCIHAVNDFRKLAKIETYSPAENIAELTARTNDEGWETVFSEWLKVSNLNEKDAIWVLSVGGGNKEKNVSANIVAALEHAQKVGARIMGVVSRDGGYTAQVADAHVLIPVVNEETITPHAEAFQGTIWHMIVADPRVMRVGNKWETIDD